MTQKTHGNDDTGDEETDLVNRKSRLKAAFIFQPRYPHPGTKAREEMKEKMILRHAIHIIWVESFRAIRTNAVAEERFAVLPDVRLDMLPVSFIIPYFFA